MLMPQVLGEKQFCLCIGGGTIFAQIMVFASDTDKKGSSGK